MTRPVKRSFTIKGHRTSISLEAPFWDALRQAATAKRITLSALVAAIDSQRGPSGLSSAVRVWVLDYVGGKEADQAEPPRAMRGPR